MKPPLPKVLLTFSFLFAFTFASIAQIQTWQWENASPPIYSVGNLLYSKCATCHHAPDGIGYLSTPTYNGGLIYADSATCHDNANDVTNVLNSGAMPPWMPTPSYRHFTGERVLTTAEKNAIISWVNAGGNTNATNPTPPTFPTGFQLPAIDTVNLVHPPYSITIHADSPDVYRNFAFKNHHADSIYITKIEFLLSKASNAAVAHHVALFIDKSGTHESIALDSAGSGPGYTFNNSPGSIGNFTNSFVYSWVPGSGIFSLPCNFGFKLRPGDNLVAQFHYPAGQTSKIDSTEIRIQYKTSAREVFSTPLIGSSLTGDCFTNAGGDTVITTDPAVGLKINPGVTKWIYRRAPIKSLPGLSNDSSIAVIGVMPHAHLRPDSLEMYSSRNGSKTNLVKIKDWDLHWQETFMTQNPLKLLKNDTLYMKARFNNSSSNPDLTPAMYGDTVRSGLNTTNEMMIGILLWAPYSTTGGQDIAMVLDPTVDTAVHAYGGGPFTQHNCASLVIGGNPTGTQGISPLTYKWSTADGTLISADTSANPYVLVLADPANYTITVTDAKFCSATATAAVVDTGTGFLKDLAGTYYSTQGIILADVVVGDSGNVYGVGWVNGNVYVDRPTPYQNYGTGWGTFLVKYNPAICGSALWATGDTVYNVGARDVNRAISRSHPYSGNLALGDSDNVFTAMHILTAAAGVRTAVVRKTTRAGVISWTTNVDSLSVTDLESDGAGGVYMTGFNSKPTAGLTLTLNAGGTVSIPSNRNFIAKIHTPATSLKFDWVRVVPDKASVEGAPTIKLDSNTALFYSSSKRLFTYNPVTGAAIDSVYPGASAASKVLRMAVNSSNGFHKIYTVDGDSLKSYKYDSVNFKITLPRLHAEKISKSIDITGSKKSPYLYVVTDTLLCYRQFSDVTQALNPLTYITTAGFTSIDKCIFAYSDSGRVYIGGDFPASSTNNVTVNNFSFKEQYGGSFLTRAHWGNTFYAKRDESEKNIVPPVIDASTPEGSLFIYPNPAGDKLNIQTNYTEGTVIGVYNLLGVQVDKFTIDGITNLYSIDLNSYATGTYVLRVRKTNGEVLSKSFVKE